MEFVRQAVDEVVRGGHGGCCSQRCGPRCTRAASGSPMRSTKAGSGYELPSNIRRVPR